MISPHGDDIDSPSCVIEEVRQTRLFQGIKEDPSLLRSFEVCLCTKSVSFCPHVKEEPPRWPLADVEQETWYSGAELRKNYKAAKRDSKLFLRRHQRFTQTFNAMFLDCSRKELRMRDLRVTDSVNAVFAFPTDLRGLESRAISLLGQYRRFHLQSVLSAQGEGEAFLRARSMSTSRPSRAMARFLALSDENDVVSMVREELDFGNPGRTDDHDDCDRKCLLITKQAIYES
jgi:hypothetical protein